MTPRNIRPEIQNLTDDEVIYIASRLQDVLNKASRVNAGRMGTSCCVEAPDGLPPISRFNG